MRGPDWLMPQNLDGALIFRVDFVDQLAVLQNGFALLFDSQVFALGRTMRLLGPPGHRIIFVWAHVASSRVVMDWIRHLGVTQASGAVLDARAIKTVLKRDLVKWILDFRYRVPDLPIFARALFWSHFRHGLKTFDFSTYLGRSLIISYHSDKAVLLVIRRKILIIIIENFGLNGRFLKFLASHSDLRFLIRGWLVMVRIKITDFFSFLLFIWWLVLIELTVSIHTLRLNRWRFHELLVNVLRFFLKILNLL